MRYWSLLSMFIMACCMAIKQYQIIGDLKDKPGYAIVLSITITSIETENV